MDSYRPYSRAGLGFRTFHMLVDELCLQLDGDYRTAVHRHEAWAKQSDLLRLQGMGQHNPERASGRYRQQPLRGLLRQVQQVPEETNDNQDLNH